MKTLLPRTALSLALVALGGCGAYPDAVGPLPAPEAPMAAPAQALVETAIAPAAPEVRATVRFHLELPAGAARKVQYLSASTQSVSVQLGTEPAVVATLVPGTTTYELELLAPIGAQTFSVKTYDGANATGNVLSQGTASKTIVEGATNAVPLTLNGVVATLALSVADTTPAIGGGSFTKPLSFEAKDAAGRTIVGDFDTPVALEATGNTTAFGLSATTLTQSGTVVNYTYNGTGVTPATFRPVLTPGGTGVTLSPRVEVTGLALDQLKPALLSDGSLGLSATVTYSNGTTDHAASWSFSGTGATLAGAVLSGSGVGSGTVTATATGASDAVKTAQANVRIFGVTTAATAPYLPGLAIPITATVSAPAASTGLSYRWVQTSGATGLIGLLSSLVTVFTPPILVDGTYGLSFEVTDAAGYTVSKPLTLNVADVLNVDKTSLTFLSTAATQTVTLPLGATVSTVTSADPTVATATGSGATVTVTAKRHGTTSLAIVATDGRRATVTVSVTTTAFEVQ